MHAYKCVHMHICSTHIKLRPEIPAGSRLQKSLFVLGKVLPRLLTSEVEQHPNSRPGSRSPKCLETPRLDPVATVYSTPTALQYHKVKVTPYIRPLGTSQPLGYTFPMLLLHP